MLRTLETECSNTH